MKALEARGVALEGCCEELPIARHSGIDMEETPSGSDEICLR